MRKRALLIGANKYDSLGVLRYARQDAEAVAEALRLYCGFTETEITLLTCEAPSTYRATQRYIELALDNLSKSHDLDLLVFGFWGHGFVVEQGPARGQRYLCGVDTLEGNLPGTSVHMDMVKARLSQVSAENTLLVLDCCQERTVGRGAATVTMTAGEETELTNLARDIRAVQGRGYRVSLPTVAVLNSCREGQKAYEWDDHEHGIFTAHLLNAFAEGYDSVAKLANITAQRVVKTAQDLGHNQCPFITIEGGGDISLGNVSDCSTVIRKNTTLRKPQRQKIALGMVGIGILLLLLLGIITTRIYAPAPAKNDLVSSPLNESIVNQEATPASVKNTPLDESVVNQEATPAPATDILANKGTSPVPPDETGTTHSSHINISPDTHTLTVTAYGKLMAEGNDTHTLKEDLAYEKAREEAEKLVVDYLKTLLAVEEQDSFSDFVSAWSSAKLQVLSKNIEKSNGTLLATVEATLALQEFQEYLELKRESQLSQQETVTSFEIDFGFYRHAGQRIADGGIINSGEQFWLEFKSNRDCYVYILNEGSSGTMIPLYPRPDIDKDSFVRQQVSVRLPDDDYDYRADDRPGREKVILVASLAPLRDIEYFTRRFIQGEAPQSDYTVLAQEISARDIGVASRVETTPDALEIEKLQGQGVIVKTISFYHQ